MPSAVRSARNGVFAVFGGCGFVFASWMSRLPDVKQMLELSAGQVSLMLLAVAIGSLAGLLMAGRLAVRFGVTAVARLGASISLSGVVLSALGIELRASLEWILPAMLLFGLGFGIWDVAQNLAGTVVEQVSGRSIMPWFHALFSAGSVAAALAGAGLIWLGVPVGLHLSAVAVLTLIAVWWGAARFLPNPDSGAEAAHPKAGSSGGSPWTEPRTLLIGVMVLAAAITEGTANDWIAIAFVEGHGLDNAMGVLAMALFLACMTVGRIAGTGLLDRYGRVLVLRVMFGLAVIGCLLVVFGTPWLAFGGVILWGVGASLGFPVGVSAAADDPARAAVRLSVVSTIGYGAMLGGPVVIGFLGDHYGVLRALLVVGVASVAAILVVPAARPLPAADPGSDRPARS